MAKCTRNKKGQFVKDWGGGPGRPRKEEDVRRAAKITRTEAEALLTKFMQMEITELEAVLKDKKRKVIEHIIGRVALMAIKNGDHSRLDFVLNRLIGKVSDKVEHSVKPRVVHNLDGGAAKFLAEGDE